MNELLPTLLIVDDEKATREGLRRALEDHFDIYLATDETSAFNILEAEKIDIVLTDLKLGGDNGMKIVEKCQSLSPAPLTVMMTAYGSVETAVEAMRRGAYDYVTKPVNIDKLEMLLLRALRSRNIETENRQLRQQIDKQYGLESLIGNSSKMAEIFDIIRQVADTKATILIQGESGTGKELVANAIHNLSSRKNKPFMAVHCAALSPQLLESELFGHEKGAFTGAFEKRIGRFEQANHGTIFLDEIGEIDAATQVKLLRVLGERKFERVGSTKTIETDVRVIAATNRNLAEMVKQGSFREDLFYRINVVKIELPPLRERKEDIPLLASSFLKEFTKENHKGDLRFSSAAEEALQRYNWPGNVRELRTAVEHGVVLCRDKEILLKDLPPALKNNDGSTPLVTSNTLNLNEMEKASIIRALEQCDQNRTAAAKLLGISRRTLHRKLNEYHLE
ncbi:MAG: sigma-54 dependent transcriptional regulator [Verrucomicrobiales bacterium]|jgi:DNA-binding NtrC family response regulator|nr:sigma-54 dependent transcriptional regulator [Verrucomicrobiales bacterium]